VHHVIALLSFEVDVDIGHGGALQAHETLEEQPPLDGIN